MHAHTLPHIRTYIHTHNTPYTQQTLSLSHTHTHTHTHTLFLPLVRPLRHGPVVVPPGRPTDHREHHAALPHEARSEGRVVLVDAQEDGLVVEARPRRGQGLAAGNRQQRQREW